MLQMTKSKGEGLMKKWLGFYYYFYSSENVW